MANRGRNGKKDEVELNYGGVTTDVLRDIHEQIHTSARQYFWLDIDQKLPLS